MSDQSPLESQAESAANAEAGPAESVTADGRPLSDAVQEVVESGRDVKERVQAIVVNLFRGAKDSNQNLRTAVQSIYETAADVVSRSAPQEPNSVLRGVIDGIASGVQTIAQSTQYAIQEATSRGQRFAGEDLDYAAKNLNAAADVLVDTVRYASERLGAELGTGVRELKTHAERAAEAARPAIAATLDAIARHPVQTAQEAASTTVRGGRLATGALLGALSGVLASAAEMLDPDKDRKQ